MSMGSVRIEGVSFRAYPNDHSPRHVHGFYAEAEVIVDLLQDGSVRLAERKDAVRPGSATRADVRHILHLAAEHFDSLVALWENHHD